MHNSRCCRASDVLRPTQLHSRCLHISFKKLETERLSQGAVRGNTKASASMNCINSKGLILPLQFSRDHPALNFQYIYVPTSNIVYIVQVQPCMHEAAPTQVGTVYCTCTLYEYASVIHNNKPTLVITLLKTSKFKKFITKS